MDRIKKKMMDIFPFFDRMQSEMIASGLIRPDPADLAQQYS